MSKRRVAYYYDREIFEETVMAYGLILIAADVGAFTYGLGHPMKPQRMRMTHELVSAYGMLDKMHVLVCSFVLTQVLSLSDQRARRATAEEMTRFHTDEYVHFLSRVTPETVEELTYHGTRCEYFLILREFLA